MAAIPEKNPRPESYQKILDAAVKEFAEHGRDGVRMESIARRAGVNKALVYRHFKNREQLFDSALRSVFAGRFELLEKLPESLPDAIRYWDEKFSEDNVFFRMLMRESLECDQREPAHAEMRSDYYKNQINGVRSFQKIGELPNDIDAECLFLMLTAILAFPNLMPSIVKLASGSEFDDPNFRERWQGSIQKLLKHIRPT